MPKPKPTVIEKDWEKELRINIDDIFEDAHSYTGPNIDETFDRVFSFTKQFIFNLLEEQRKETIESYQKNEQWLYQKCKGCGKDVSYCDDCNRLWST